MVRPRWALFALLAALGAACSSSTRVQVTSLSTTNRGRPIYMMVRSGEQMTLEEPYEDAARRMFSRDPDPKVIARQVIIPGTQFTTSLPTPEDDIGIYFFFTEHDDRELRFRMVVSRRKLPADIQVLLGEDRIADSSYRAR